MTFNYHFIYFILSYIISTAVIGWYLQDNCYLFGCQLIKDRVGLGLAEYQI